MAAPGHHRPYGHARPAPFQPDFSKPRQRAANRKGTDFSSVVVASLDRTALTPASELSMPPHVPPSARHKREVPLPRDMRDSPSNAMATRLVHQSFNKSSNCSLNAVCWTPDAATVITGSASGAFTRWAGTTFNYESVQQNCARAVRVLCWSHSGEWLLSADDSGEVLGWHGGVVKEGAFNAHKDVVRGLSMAPTDMAFASCSDDGTVKIWDFWRRSELATLKGHHSDVRDVDWHPTASLVASGSKDSTVKLWDPRTAATDAVRTLRDHSQPVHKVRWNRNGHWLATASQDRSVAVWDLRTMRTLRVFRPPCSEPTAIAWHPEHEALLTAGHLGGELTHWLCSGSSAPAALESESSAAAAVPLAHDASIWDLAWHPLGTVLASVGHDKYVRFWSRPRPGDTPAQYDHKGSERRRARLGDVAAALVGVRGLEHMARAGTGVTGARYDEALKASGAAAPADSSAMSGGMVRGAGGGGGFRGGPGGFRGGMPPHMMHGRPGMPPRPGPGWATPGGRPPPQAWGAASASSGPASGHPPPHGGPRPRWG